MAGTSLPPSPLSPRVAISDGSQVYDSELNKIKEDPERIQKQAPPRCWGHENPEHHQ